MPRIGARSDLKKSQRYIKENLGPEVNEKLKAKLNERLAKQAVAKNAKTLNAQRLHLIAQQRRQSYLERTPASDVLEKTMTVDDIATIMALK